MSTIKEPTSYIKPPEAKIAKITLILACFMSVPIPSLLKAGSANAYLLQLIPSAIVPLFFVLPIAIYYGFIVNRKVKFNDRVKENHLMLKAQIKRRIIFQVKMKKHHEGTLWNLRNCNQFVWTSTTVLLERRIGTEVSNEKHKLGVVGSSESVMIESALSNHELAMWRVMVITPQGKLIEFPAHWLEDITEHSENEELEEAPL